MTDIIRIDKPIVVGEKPDPLQYQFLDATGKAYDLTGYALRLVIWEESGAITPTMYATAVWDAAATAQARYQWTGTECPVPGRYNARFWTGNSVQKYASPRIVWDAEAPGGPVPVI